MTEQCHPWRQSCPILCAGADGLDSVRGYPLIAYVATQTPTDCPERSSFDDYHHDASSREYEPVASQDRA
jgi:hypothetical protein